MSCCDPETNKTILSIRKGGSFVQSFKFQDVDGNSFDLSSSTGTAYLRQEGETIKSLPLATYFTDQESDNFDFALTEEEIEALEIGSYQILFVINDGENRHEMPEDGEIILIIKHAL